MYTMPPRKKLKSTSATAAAESSAPSSRSHSRAPSDNDDEATVSEVMHDEGFSGSADELLPNYYNNSLDRRLRRTYKGVLERRPIYSSEEEEDEEMRDEEVCNAHGATSMQQMTLRTSAARRPSLSQRLLERSTPIRQWSIDVALARGPIAEATKGFNSVATSADATSSSAAAPSAPEIAPAEVDAARTKRAQIPMSYSKPFDRKRARSKDAKSETDEATTPSPATVPAKTYVAIYAAKRVHGDLGYSVTDHGWWADSSTEDRQRPSLPLSAADLASLTPVTPGDACRANGLTLCRHMRVKVKKETRAELTRCMKRRTGEFDQKVLRLCDSGQISKCRIYKTDESNYTLLTTAYVLSGEPLCAWMGTLREKNTFAQRVGFETSLSHIWAYDIAATELPGNYAGPDLVIDANDYGNESHFFRDPKWSYNQSDANVSCRIVWHQRAGLPFLVFVALCDIAPNAELFVDWGDRCWKTVWRTQLTALATNSHLCHFYLKALQEKCRQAGIDILPQLAGTKFSIYPLSVEKQKSEQQLFLEDKLSPFRTTSATTLERKAKADLKKKRKGGPGRGKKKVNGDAASATLSSSPSPSPSPTSESQTTTPSPTMTDEIPLVEPLEEESTVPASSSSSLSNPSPAASAIVQSSPRKARQTGLHIDTTSNNNKKETEEPTKRDGKSSSSQSRFDDSDAAHMDIDSERLKHDDITPKDSSKDNDDDSSTNDSNSASSAPSSPYTPSFGAKSASYTMQTVFRSAMLNESLSEQQRIRRRIKRHRAERLPRKTPIKIKPLLHAHAAHRHGQHTFQLLEDQQEAFFKSGTSLGREAKVDVSEETKKFVEEAWNLLRPRDLPDSRSRALIRNGDVPKSRVYEVVGLSHPARFFTRPDQTPFSLVANGNYNRDEPIGVYIGVYRDFQVFHKASDRHAMQQVYAYDCFAAQIPGPPNPYLTEEEKQVPQSEQLAYRGGDLICESLYYGNEIRFMNDAYGRSGMDGTVNAQATIAWDPERHWPCIVVRALHRIEKGDEIICDYGDSFWNKVARSLMMDHAAYGDEVRHLIMQTEQWLTLHGIALPSGPKAKPLVRRDLPHLFTTDFRIDTVTYPKYFGKTMKEIADEESGDSSSTIDAVLTEDQAKAKLAEGLKKVEDLRMQVEAKEREEEEESLKLQAVEIKQSRESNSKLRSKPNGSGKNGKKRKPTAGPEPESEPEPEVEPTDELPPLIDPTASPLTAPPVASTTKRAPPKSKSKKSRSARQPRKKEQKVDGLTAATSDTGASAATPSTSKQPALLPNDSDTESEEEEVVDESKNYSSCYSHSKLQVMNQFRTTNDMDVDDADERKENGDTAAPQPFVIKLIAAFRRSPPPETIAAAVFLPKETDQNPISTPMKFSARVQRTARDARSRK